MNREIKIKKYYKMDDYDVVCIDKEGTNCFMLTYGITAGEWPGYEYIDDYDEETKEFCRRWKGIISDMRLLKKWEAEENPVAQEAMKKAANDGVLFGTKLNRSWLGSSTDNNNAWYISCDGGIYISDQKQNYVVAPIFKLDETKIVLDGSEIKPLSSKKEDVEIGKTYKIGNYKAACVTKDDKKYLMQTLGMTSGKWAKNEDFSRYDGKTKMFYRRWKDAVSDMRLLKKWEIEKYNIARNALKEAAANHNSSANGMHGACAWVGTETKGSYAWGVSDTGDICSGLLKYYNYAVAPAFTLDGSKVIVEGNEIKLRQIENDNGIKIGKVYHIGDYKAVCISQDGSEYLMQTYGMTAGEWPGEGNISDYDDETKAFYQEWHLAISDMKLLGSRDVDNNDTAREALRMAARDESVYDIGNNFAWLGTESVRGCAWYIDKDGNISNYSDQTDCYIVAPAFSLDGSKITIEGDEIKLKQATDDEKDRERTKEDTCKKERPDERKVEDAYKKGLDDAWEAARKITLPEERGGIKIADLAHIFDCDMATTNIIESCTASEAVEKIRTWEEKKIGENIKIGDVVRNQNIGSNGVVTHICKDGEYVDVIEEDGQPSFWPLSECTKTDCHLEQMSDILKQLQEVE